MALSEQQRKANLKLGLILASVAVVFLIGFVTKIVVFGR
jgi:hypothetical protein